MWTVCYSRDDIWKCLDGQAKKKVPDKRNMILERRLFVPIKCVKFQWRSGGDKARDIVKNYNNKEIFKNSYLGFLTLSYTSK